MVSTDIRPFVTMFSLPAATVISPASPELRGQRGNAGRNGRGGAVDRQRPETVTAMLPPLPVPNVSVVIWPFGVIDSDPAVTVMLPALPVLSRKVSAVIPVVGPSLMHRRSSERR
jgi:hypothetical protein